MKKKLFLITTLLSFAFTLSVEGQNKTLGQENDIIFSDAEPFCEDLAAVKFDEKWGFINPNGEVVIPFEYDEIQNFQNNLAAVKKSNKWGFINKKGQLIIPVKYEEVSSFHEGLAAVKLNNKWGYINTLGNSIISHKYTSSEYDRPQNHYFKNGYAVEKINNNCWGLVDKQGNETKLEGWCEHDSEGLFRYLRNKKYGFINNKGYEVIKPIYDFVDPFVGGYSVVKLNKKHGIIDRAGNVVVPIKYDFAPSEVYLGGIARMMLNGKFGLIDMNEKILLPFIYTFISLDKKGSTDLIAVQSAETGKWGYVNKNNNIVIPLKYQREGYFVDGFAEVTINNKSGVIDKSGKTVIPLIYDKIGSYKIEGPFSSGYCLVKYMNYYGYIDKLGNSLEINLGKDEMYRIGLRRESRWDGSPSTKKYLTAAVGWFKKSALEGNCNASYKVGYYYATGALGKIDYAEAVKWLEKSLSPNNDTNGDEYFLLGECFNIGGYGITKDDTKAFKYFKEGANKNNAYCLNNLAYMYASQKNYSEALTAIDKAISLVPKKPEFYDSKGELYLMMGKDDEALKMWGKVVELNPKFLDNYPQGTELYNQLKAKGKIK